MDIEQWLITFHAAWKNHDVKKVMSLFTNDVKYWETPHFLVASKLELEAEWQAILDQQDIEVEYDAFCSFDNKHVVKWKLAYNKDGLRKESGGVYLIKLNSDGLCNYFYYVGESKEVA